MNKKLIGTLIVILSLIIIGGIIYFLFFSNIFGGGEKTENETPKQTTPVIDTTVKEKPLEITPTIKENKQITINVESKSMNKEMLAQVATSFAERFGSYSNQSNYSNINDLKIFMSQKMSDWADNYIKENRAKNQANDIYYGITTKSVSSEVKVFDDDLSKATILIKTRRREALGTTNNVSKTYNQDILITFVKEKGAWKVDSAYWQDLK